MSLLQEANKALRAIERVVRRSELERLAQGAVTADARRAAPPVPAAPAVPASLNQSPRDIVVRALAGADRGPLPLNEVASKRILAGYGIALPEEVLVGSAEEAVMAAQRIGYPVVLKAVAAELTHKSDAGAVVLGLANADEVRSAYRRITESLAHRGFAGAVDGMLVCQQIRGGLELVLGLNRDPEVGIVAMAGSGGVLLELAKDVAFCAPPISRDKAVDLLERTHAARLMRGYRGGAKLDLQAAVDALVALGRLAVELGEFIEAVDVNPFVVLPRGGLALDALVVLRGAAPGQVISSADAPC